MESKAVAYCVITVILGIIAAATGLAGEATKVKASEVHILFNTCVYPSSPALALGIVSAVFTIITRIHISVTFGGCGCCQKDHNSTPISKLLFVFSWVASVVAVVLLFAAATLNNRQGGEVNSYGYITCYIVKPGIFAVGAVLALLSAVFAVLAYMISKRRPETTTYPAIALPVVANIVGLEKNAEAFPPQQYAHHEYPLQ